MSFYTNTTKGAALLMGISIIALQAEQNSPRQSYGTSYSLSHALNGPTQLKTDTVSSPKQRINFATISAKEKLAEEFSALFKEWEEQTMAYSSPTKIVFHPAYQKIIGMGPAALPYIMKVFHDNPADWVYALQKISRKNIGEDAKTPQEITNAWLDWGRQNNYLSN